MQLFDEEIEKHILGSIIISPKSIAEVLEILSPEDFYVEMNAGVYRSMVEAFNDGKSIDIISLKSYMKKNRIDPGKTYLTELMDYASGISRIDEKAHMVIRYSMLRKLRETINSVDRKLNDLYADPIELVSKIQTDLLNITGRLQKRPTQHISQAVKDYLKKMDTPQGSLIGAPSGFIDLDKKTSGFQPGNFIVIAARPGQGKTALATSMIRDSAIIHKVPIAHYSLEMSSDENMLRMTANLTGLSTTDINRRKLDEKDWAILHEKMDTLSKAPIYVNDSPQLTPLTLKSDLYKLKTQHDIQIAIVDYIQLMTGDGKYHNREAEVSDISRNLKLIAKDLGISIIALAQLNREVEKRTDKRPKLSDLRDTGALEQDADIVMLLSRPETWMDKSEIDGATQRIGNREVSMRGLGILSIAKHRNGPIGDILLKFKEKQTSFISYTEVETDQGDLPF